MSFTCSQCDFVGNSSVLIEHHREVHADAKVSDEARAVEAEAEGSGSELQGLAPDDPRRLALDEAMLAKHPDMQGVITGITSEAPPKKRPNRPDKYARYVQTSKVSVKSVLQQYLKVLANMALHINEKTATEDDRTFVLSVAERLGRISNDKTKVEAEAGVLELAAGTSAKKDKPKKEKTRP